jgi:hypothetical protein
MAILANKNGTIISVVETFKKDHWRENCPNGSLFKVTAAQTHRKVFTGPNAVNEALEWIGTPEALELVQDYNTQQGGTE